MGRRAAVLLQPAVTLTFARMPWPPGTSLTGTTSTSRSVSHVLQIVASKSSKVNRRSPFRP
jgi:hypothetical protein